MRIAPIIPSLKFVIITIGLVITVSSIVKAQKPTIEYHAENEFGEIYVYKTRENPHLRCLSFESPLKELRTNQSCMNLENPKHLEFTYTRMCIAALLLTASAPKNILIIGLGGGTLVNALHDTLPSSYIDVVEINPEVIKVSKKYFSLSKSERITFYNEDILNFLKKGKYDIRNKYDLIIVDAFDNEYIPKDLLTPDFVKNLRAALSTQGVVAINTFKDSKTFKLETDLYQNEFSKTYELFGKNRIILVRNDKLPSLADLKLPPGIKTEEFSAMGLNEKLLLSWFK